MASRDAYTYGAEAVTKTRLCRFEVTEFHSLLDDFPVVRSRLLEIANDELAAAQEQMVVLGRKSAIERVASFIRVIQEKFDYLGLTIETVSRTFGELTKNGIIELPTARTLRVVAPGRLEELAETAI